MPDFTIKANDTLPFIEARLGFTGLAIVPDLGSPGTVIEFVMREVDPANAAQPRLGVPPKVKGIATVVDVATARVRYSWRRSDTDEPGQYLAEWEVTFPGGGVQTFPLVTYHTVDVLADLDDQSGA